MSGPELKIILDNVPEAHREHIKSIMYAGNNEFSRVAYESLKSNYLDRELRELKLIDVALREKNIMQQLLQDLNMEHKLTSLTLSNMFLDRHCEKYIVKLVE